MRTMSFTTGILMGAGDSIAQTCIEKKKKYDYIRTVRFVGFGFAVGGPVFRTWYVGIDKFFKGSTLAPVKMMLCDQLLFAPSFLTFFLTSMGLLRGDEPSVILKKYKEDIIPVLITNWKIWPAVQLLNFYCVPVQHRVLVVNFVALGWNTYLAWMAESDRDKVEPKS